MEEIITTMKITIATSRASPSSRNGIAAEAKDA